MQLEEQLRAAAEPWLAEESLPAERAAHLKALVTREKRKKGLFRLSLAASVVAVLALNGPAVVSLASEVPVVGQFITRMAELDQGAVWADEHGYVVPVGKSATDNGYTFTVDSVVADASRTIVYFTVDGPGLRIAGDPFMSLEARFNRRQWPDYASQMSDIVDGRLVGQLNLPPLPHPTAQVEVWPDNINGLAGEWRVSFVASRTALDKLTRTLEPNLPIRGEGYDLVVRRVLLTPTETRVEVSGTAADNLKEQARPDLLAGGKPLPMHLNSGGIIGTETRSFDLVFERVGPGVQELVLRWPSVVLWVDGGPEVELTPASQSEFAGIPIKVESVSISDGRTEVTLGASDDAVWGKFREWRLIDAAGQEFRTNSESGGDEPGQRRFSFETPGAQGLVRLIALEHSEPHMDSFDVVIPID